MERRVLKESKQVKDLGQICNGIKLLLPATEMEMPPYGINVVRKINEIHKIF